MRYIACSNYEAWRLLEAIWISDSKDLHRFACYQPQYSLVVRDIEEEIIPVCQLKGVGMVPWGPMAGGFLTGKYQPGQRSGGRHAISEEGWVFPTNFFAANADETLAVLLEVWPVNWARRPAQVALRWVLEQPAVTSAIAGARTVAQARDNFLAGGWTLPTDALRRLTEASRPRMRYPLAMEDNMNERRDGAMDMPSLE